MSRRAWVWIGRGVAIATFVGLVIYLAEVGLDTADKLGSVLSLLFTAAAFVASYLASTRWDRSLDTGNALASPDAVNAHRVIPRQLPTGQRHFVGRMTELSALTEFATRAVAESGTVIISAVNGTAGVGKTTLAVHWAHQVASRFPDGQLYVDLRGFDATGTPMTPAEAIRGFLDAFQLAPDQIPTSSDAQRALFRSLVADRRILILLDNARDSDQVRPLLPGSSTCLVVVTSRNCLLGLVTHDGAESVALDVLAPEEARILLDHYIGQHRLDAEPEAVASILGYTGRLPLALALVGARARNMRSRSLARIVEALADERRRLDSFDIGDSSIDVRTVFSWSYQALTPNGRRMFRSLGLHPGPDISRATVAWVNGDSGPTDRILDELTWANLINESIESRYALHDLLHDYAAERAVEEETSADRQTIIRRILDFYVSAAMTADRLLDPYRDPLPSDARGLVDPQTVGSTYDAAWQWFEDEHAVLINIVYWAARYEFDTHASELAWALANYLDRQGYWTEYAATQQTSLVSAERNGNLLLQATTHRILGWTYVRASAFDDALAHFQEALRLFDQIEDRPGAAMTHHASCWALMSLGHYVEALDHASLIRELMGATGNEVWVAFGASAAARCRAHLGECEEAISEAIAALMVFEAAADGREGRAELKHTLGFAKSKLDRPEESISEYVESAALYQALGDRAHEATVLLSLGDGLLAVGRSDEAEDAWKRALAGFEHLARPEAEIVRKRLLGLTMVANRADRLSVDGCYGEFTGP